MPAVLGSSIPSLLLRACPDRPTPKHRTPSSIQVRCPGGQFNVQRSSRTATALSSTSGVQTDMGNGTNSTQHTTNTHMIGNLSATCNLSFFFPWFVLPRFAASRSEAQQDAPAVAVGGALGERQPGNFWAEAPHDAQERAGAASAPVRRTTGGDPRRPGASLPRHTRRTNCNKPLEDLDHRSSSLSLPRTA